MNLDALSFALNEITNLVANFNKKNFKASCSEINGLIAVHGAEADRHLLRCLFSHVDFTGDGSSGRDYFQVQFLIQETTSLVAKPNFISLLCFALENPLLHQKTLRSGVPLLLKLKQILGLKDLQAIAFAIALSHSNNQEIFQNALGYIKKFLPPLLETYNNSGLFQEIAVEISHLLLNFVGVAETNNLISPELKEQFLKAVRDDFVKDRAPSVLYPLLYTEQEDIPLELSNPDNLCTPTGIMATSLADTVREIGYGFTSSVEECRNNLMQLGVREITPPSIARVLGMMAKHTTGLADSIPVQAVGASNNQWLENEGPDHPQKWNVDFFVQALKDLAPHLNWKDVVSELDHPGFLVPSKAGMQLIVRALARGINGDTFPIEMLYKPWKNSEGQLSWFSMSLKHPDVFCFADHPHHKVNAEPLKPHDEDSRDIAVWRSLDLVDTLLRLQEQGLYRQVWDLFSFPRQNCPDILTMAILQIPLHPDFRSLAQSTWSRMKHELLSQMMPIFLANQFNATQVLHFAWFSPNQSQTIRSIILHSMSEWYMRGDPNDQSRLSRILDVAQDIKALHVLLNSSPFLFVIDLACLASRREFLKLDKWLGDKIAEHGEPFIIECLTYLKRRSPVLLQQMVNKDDPAMTRPPHNNLPPDTVMTMVTRLSYMCSTGNVSQETKELTSKMHGQATAIFMSRHMGGPGMMPSSKPMPPPMAQGAPRNTTPMIDPLSALAGASLPGAPQGPMGPIGPSSGAPGSPIKNLVNLNQPPPPVGSAMSNIASQMQGLSLNTSSMPPPVMTSLSQPQKNSISHLPGLGMGTLGLGSLPTTSMTTGSSMPPRPPMPPQGMLDRVRGIGATPPGGGAPEAPNMFPNMAQNFPKEIEDEANSYFQRIYNHNQENFQLDKVLEMLKRFKESGQKKEQDIFACMLRNLFEEYKFFPQYPDKELNTTAILFGGIIEQGIVTYYDLGIALRYVLEALKKPPPNKMFSFGITALERFRSRLKDYPQYCQHVKAISHFQQFPVHLQDFTICGMDQQDPPNSASMPPPPPFVNPASQQASAPQRPVVQPPPAVASTAVQPPASVGAIARPGTVPSKGSLVNKVNPSIATATNIDTLIMGQEECLARVVPSEAVMDKISFIFNNLSLVNMEQKGKELREYLTDDLVVWAAQYMVMKRASIEHNFHTLYSKLLDSLDLPLLTKQIVLESFRNVRVLLGSEKGANSFSDRSLLKNLGHWLGMVTLGKNRPILDDELNLKCLLYEAFNKDGSEMLYVVPFVAKVMESAILSKIFCPPCPWTMGIMRVLLELHQEEGIKLNLKFEIEVLCKTLQVEINDIPPAHFLHDLTYVVQQPLLRTRHLEEPQLVAGAMDTGMPSAPEDAEEPLHINMPTITSVPLTVANLGAAAAAANQPSVPAHTLQASSGGAGAGSGSQSPGTTVAAPRFTLEEVMLDGGLFNTNKITFDESLPLFIQYPPLKQMVRNTIDTAVKEIVGHIVEACMRICVTTCQLIVHKDFALDPSEERVRTSAYHFIRYTTAGMALIKSRDPIQLQVPARLKEAFYSCIRTNSKEMKEMVDDACASITQENADLICNFIQKAVLDKATPELEKRLGPELEQRRKSFGNDYRFCDRTVLNYQDRLPESLRLKMPGPRPDQIVVYEEFGSNLPGFLSSAEKTAATQAAAATTPSVTPTGQLSDEIVTLYQKLSSDCEACITQMKNIAPETSKQITISVSLQDQIKSALTARDINSACQLIQKAIEGLMEGFVPGAEHDLLLLYRDCHLIVLKGLQNPRAFGPNWTNRQITRYVIDMREECRFNVDAVEALVRSHLLYVPQYDQFLSNVLDNGANSFATMFSMTLMQRIYNADVEKIAQEGQGDFVCTVEALNRIAHSRNAPEGLMPMLDQLRQQVDSMATGLDRVLSGPSALMHSGISQARESDDPSGLVEKTEILFKEWVNLYTSPEAGRDSSKAFTAFVAKMHQHGILKTDDLITRFFRLCCEITLEMTYRNLSDSSQSAAIVRNKCYYNIDALVRLIALLVRHSGDDKTTITKVNLLNKVLGIIAGVMMQDIDQRQVEFHQLMYQRTFIMLFIELNAPDAVLEAMNFQVLTAFCNTFHVLRPTNCPGFTYAWLELVSHRVFVGRMLAITPSQRAWNMYAQLLVDAFKFLAPFLRNAEMPTAMQSVYKGLLRILLILLHDFPEFLCDFHYTFCDVIPTNCIQLRNLILSAFPRTMRLPDPFTPTLRVDQLPEVGQSPRVPNTYANNIQPATFRRDLDSYLKTRSPVTFLGDMRSVLQSSGEPGMRYNIPLMNALVLHVGVQAIEYIRSKGQTLNTSTVAHSAHMDLFQNLAIDLDNEGRYIYLNAIANHLRFPNSHTHYFSCVLLYLFGEANSEAIQEQITRVLLERLIVNRPHPWGLLITFIELLKNPSLKFWSHDFVHCAPEIEKILTLLHTVRV